MSLIASTLGYSRQYVYKQPKDAASKLQKQQAVKELVLAERKKMPRIGTRKIHYLISEKLEREGLKFGRDKLFELMRNHGLHIRPRRRYTQTTMSKHWLRKWPNIIKGRKAKAVDEIRVSDITYIKTMEGNCYLNMVTDQFSRKIIGHALADNMETASMIKALKMAIASRSQQQSSTIHHSDRGLQYCSNEYANLTESNNIQLSMTDNGDPYENALAERMNRTIKEEFGLDVLLKNKNQAQQLIEEGIFLYNNKRPHLALNMLTPQQVYQTKSR